MNCPDINRLIDLAQANRLDQDLQAHLESCSSCQVEFELVRELPAAFKPAVEVPEMLVTKTMAAVGELGHRQARGGLVSVHTVVAFLLGVVTTVLAIGVTGSLGSSGLNELLVFSVAVGLTSGLMESRSSARELSGRVEEPVLRQSSWD